MVKTERGRFTSEQKVRIEETRQAGGMAEVVRSLEDVHKIFGESSRITINF